MKPIYEKLIQFREEGFAWKTFRGSSYDCPWHLHPEYELILVVQGRGYRIVGDQITSLQAGDLVLVGPNLPHIYQTDEHGDHGRAQIHCVLIQFEEQAWSGLLGLPALEPVRRLLNRAALGLEVTGRTRQRVAQVMLEMGDWAGLRRINAFLEILDLLSRARGCHTISSVGFADQVRAFDEERVNRIWQYIHQRLEQPLRLPELARLVHMSEGAFSRFFRTRMGKTFPAIVNELRVGRACRLLAESDLPVTDVALACGYTNLSNFNRQFHRLKRTTPLAFRKRYGGG